MIIKIKLSILILRTIVLLSLLSPLSLHAEEFVVDNISYTTFDKIYIGESALRHVYDAQSMGGYEHCVIVSKYNKNITDIVIPESVEHGSVTYTVVGFENECFKDSKILKSIVLPNTIYAISNYTFDGCINLKSISLPSSVKCIGSYAFRNCGITSVSIPEGVEILYPFAFCDCETLASIDLPNSIKEIYPNTFQRCHNLTSLNISDSVTKIGDYAFSYSALKEIVIPANVTSLGVGAFFNCTQLSAAVIGSGVPRILKQTFMGCTSLCSVDLPNNLITIDENAFSGCSSMTSIVIPESTYAIYNEAFKGSGLREISIPNSVNFLGDGAFTSCPQLSSVTIGRQITELKYNFGDCPNLENIKIAEGNPVYDSRDNCNAIIKTAENELVFGTKSTVIPTSVTSIGYKAFIGLDISSIEIPESVTKIGTCAFQDCSLTHIEIPSSVTEIGDFAFANCKNLTKLVIPASVRTVGGAVVRGCTALESLSVEDGNRVYDSRDNCNAIILSHDNYLFSTCKNTVIPASVNKIGGFSYRDDLTTFVIPDHVTTIVAQAFMGCKNLNKIVIPKSVTSIGELAFCFCPSAEVWCMSDNPYIVQQNIFNHGPETICEILYVPIGTQDSFRANPYWNIFKNILDSDFSNLPTYIGKDIIITENQVNDDILVKRYNLNGISVSQPVKGLNILRMSDGTVKKVMVK